MPPARALFLVQMAAASAASLSPFYAAEVFAAAGFSYYLDDSFRIRLCVPAALRLFLHQDEE